MRCIFFLLAPLLTLISFAGAAAGQTPILPLDQIHPGMHGVGRTIFQGDQIAEFQVEILGVVQNMGPRQAVIFAKLSGGPLADTGVIEGMSGSPVYIDGKLIGAVALGYPFAKSAIAGITPIEQMIAQQKRAQAATRAEVESPPPPPWAAKTGPWKLIAAAPAGPRVAADTAPAPAAATNGGSGMNDGMMPELQTPLVLAGFSSRAVAQFLPQLQQLGLRPMLGGTGTAAPLGRDGAAPAMGNPKDLQPGDMISVQLLRGDLGVSADGTVTYIDGNQVFAFGHRFLAAGATAMPFSKANVLTLIPGLMSSTKMDTPGEPMGVIHEDLSQGVYGSFGGRAAMIPIHVQIHSAGEPTDTYSFEMVDSRFLSPVLLNMALFSTLDANERSVGAQTLDVNEAIDLEGGNDIHLDNLYSSDQAAPLTAAASASQPLALLYGSGLETIPVKGIEINVNASDQKQILTLEAVYSDRQTVAPGDRLEVTAVFDAPDGSQVARQIPLTLPESLPPGGLTVWVGEGAALARVQPDGLEPAPGTARSLAALTEEINRLPRSNIIYARVTRAATAYELDGAQFPAPPPSLARALAANPAADTAIHAEANSTVIAYQSEALPFVVSGLKAIHIEVRAR